MGDTRANPLIEAMHANPLGRVQKQLADLRDHWAEQGVAAFPVPLAYRDPDKPGRDWLPEPEWISGWNAFDILRLQTEPYGWAPPIARICQIIGDQWGCEETRLNYALASLPPNHELLKGFPLGSNHWFRALYSLLTLDGAEAIDGWDGLVSDLYDWIGPSDSLRIRAADLFENALTHHWSIHEMALPEAKQEPVWSFPKAMTWIATRDYLALARIGYFRRPADAEEAAATDGVCKYNTEALGWLHTAITFLRCECGALSEFGFDAYKHCTCISVAWEELVHFNGGLTAQTPELVFNLQEGWLSMTWPEGADDLRFLRRDILKRWPVQPTPERDTPAIERSTTNGERDCRAWLLKEFAADPEKRRSKRDFREAALAAFLGRLSERGFNLRVWPELARAHGRDGAGAKRKS